MARGITAAFMDCGVFRVSKEPPGYAMTACGGCGQRFMVRRHGNAFRFWGQLKAMSVAHGKVCPKLEAHREAVRRNEERWREAVKERKRAAKAAGGTK